MAGFIGGHPKQRATGVGRRSFLGGSLALTVGATAGSGLLTGCGGDEPGTGSTEIPLARPDSPVTLPLFDDNPPIDDGLAPETGGALKVLNYADYMSPAVIRGLEKKYGVQLEITPITNYDELLAKLRQPGADFDVVFGGPSVMSRLAFARLVQPFNKTYLPNLDNVWDSFQDPFYDVGAQYSVPYTIYTSGVGYRADRVSSVPANGWDLIWDTAYSGKVHILDDNRESLGMSMLRAELTSDLNTEDPEIVNEAAQLLAELIPTQNIKLGIQAYVMIPEGTATVHHTWSGDMVNAQWYLPKGEPVEVLGYWCPEVAPPIGNDCMSVGANATKPVLAHTVINDLLDNELALKNFSWNGYQPPLTALSVDSLVEDGYVPANVSTAVVQPKDFETGLNALELSPEGDVVWQTAWAGFKTGA